MVVVLPLVVVVVVVKNVTAGEKGEGTLWRWNLLEVIVVVTVVVEVVVAAVASKPKI